MDCSQIVVDVLEEVIPGNTLQWTWTSKWTICYFQHRSGRGAIDNRRFEGLDCSWIIPWFVKVWAELIWIFGV